MSNMTKNGYIPIFEAKNMSIYDACNTTITVSRPAVLEPHPRKEDALVFGRRFVFFQILSLTLSIDSDGSTSSTPVKPASYVSFKRVPNLTKILMADLETCPIAASVK